MFTPISNQADAAQKRLIGQYAESAMLIKLIRVEAERQVAIENVCTQLNTQRLIDVAVGAQLDGIGSIVGILRTPGDTDDIYRLKIYAKIKINTSDGQPEQAIQVFALMTQVPLVLLYEYPTEIQVQSQYVPPDQATVDLLLNILSHTIPAGVRCDSIVSFDPSEAFAFDGPLPGLGWGDDSDPLAGGMFGTGYYRDTTFQFAGDDLRGGGFGSSDDPLVGGLIDGSD